MVNEDLEESVHQEDSVWQDAAAVQQDRLKHTIALINHLRPTLVNQSDFLLLNVKASVSVWSFSLLTASDVSL